MFKVIVTGPESSGKTTLCKNLSNYFKTPFLNEYAREHLTVENKNYTQEDLLIIAKKQFSFEKNYKILDTDLITIKIWSIYKYGNCNNWILKKIEQQRLEKRHYLLCKPDIAWKKDPLREHPNSRSELFNIYQKELESLNHNYYQIKGKTRNVLEIAKKLKKNSIF